LLEDNADDDERHPNIVIKRARWLLTGRLHTPTDIREDCVVRHLKVSYDKNRIDPACENCVVRHNLLDCVNRP
jgi:hypothetical protein